VAVIEIEKVEENLLRRTDSESDSHIPLGQVAVFCLKKNKKEGVRTVHKHEESSGDYNSRKVITETIKTSNHDG